MNFSEVKGFVNMIKFRHWIHRNQFFIVLNLELLSSHQKEVTKSFGKNSRRSRYTFFQFEISLGVSLSIFCDTKEIKALKS